MKDKCELCIKIGIVIAYFLIYFVWGSTYYFIGVALKSFPPFLLGGIRFSIAGLILLFICFLRGEKIFDANLIKSSIISGIVLLFIDMAVIMLAQRYITSSLVAIVASSTAIWIMAFDVPMWSKNFKNPYRIIGIFTGFFGVLMLFSEQISFRLTSTTHGEYGMAIVIFGCISWAIGTLYTKYKSSESVKDFAGGAWQMIFASIAFWIFSIIFGDIFKLDFKSIEIQSILSLIYLIIFGSILAYSAYIWLLKVRSATEVGTHAYINPIVALLLGVFIGGENVTFLQIAGLVIILISVALATIATPNTLKK